MQEQEKQALQNGNAGKVMSRIRLFALQGITYTLQQDVDSTCAWVDKNLLLLNTLKYCYQLFSRKPTSTTFIPAWQ